MKKILVSALALLTAASIVLPAYAGAFEDYYDYINDDGTYSYYFAEGLTVTLDEEWYKNTIVIPGDDGVTFYHKESYDLYEKEGLKGGRLFTIGASVNTDFKDYPHFEYLGFDEENAMNYFVVLPTDYQGYEKDPDVSAQYQSLWAGVYEVIDEIEIPGEDADDDAEDADDDQPSMLPGGWSVTDDAEITEEALAAFEKASETLTGAEFDPVALLATQLVSGTNYCLLCRETATVPDAKPVYAQVYIYADLQGNAEILGVKELSFGIDDLDYEEDPDFPEDFAEMDDLED